ncbi:HD-GYP domain-containing protein [Paenibacillus cellulosilyticus]|nr:HD-GYP domain-containing protein [Paenibacillus cellulosilyticus]
MLLPLIGYGLLHRFSSMDHTFKAPTGHFYVVSTVAAIAFVLALVVGIAGIRMRNVKVTFVSLAYVSLAEVFTLHGLSTPGFLLHASSLPTAAAQLSLSLAVFWLWLSSMSSDRLVVRMLARHNVMLLPMWTLILFIVCSLLFNHTSWIHGEFVTNPWFKGAQSVVEIGLIGWTMRRYWQAYLAWGSPLHFMIVHSCGLLIVSQFIMVTGKIWQVSWWGYHVTLLISVIFMIIGVMRQYSAQDAAGSSLLRLFRANPREWIETCLSPNVRALIVTTEKRDAYTAGHNYRVALYALRLGERMGLNTEQLRAIALGGIVHDVGKLKVPDSILNKPGKLTPFERDVIERHPLAGYDVCKRLGFMKEELAIIRNHHEKWDGTGYPDRLRHDNIPLLARVTAVADVYDALTSSRSYRKAMSHGEALAIITSERGAHFDPECVDAWLRLAEEDQLFFEQMSGSDRGLQQDQLISSSS